MLDIVTNHRSSLIASSQVGRELLRTQRMRKDAPLARQLRKLSPEERAALDRAPRSSSAGGE